MQYTQCKLRWRITIVGGPVEPLQSFGCVWLDTYTIQIDHAYVVLGIAAALFGGQGKPAQGLGGILQHTVAVEVAVAQLKTGCHITAFSGLYQSTKIAAWLGTCKCRYQRHHTYSQCCFKCFHENIRQNCS